MPEHTSQYFDLHGLLTIKVQGRLAVDLMKRLVVNPCAPAEADIEVVEQSAMLSMAGVAESGTDACFDGEWRRSRKGQDSIVVRTGEVWRIEYLASTTSSGTLWLIFLMVLRQRLSEDDAYLLHGAVLVQPEAPAFGAVALFAPRGTGKTVMVLRALQQGWRYLAEDKFIYHQGQAYALERELLLRPWHASVLPQSHPVHTRLRGLDRWRLRSRFTQWFGKVAPETLHQLVKDRVLPSLRLDCEVLSQDQLVPRAPLAKAYLLQSELPRQLPLADPWQRVVAIQSMAFQALQYEALRMLVAGCDISLPSDEKLLKQLQALPVEYLAVDAAIPHFDLEARHVNHQPGNTDV